MRYFIVAAVAEMLAMVLGVYLYLDCGKSKAGVDFPGRWMMFKNEVPAGLLNGDQKGQGERLCKYFEGVHKATKLYDQLLLLDYFDISYPFLLGFPVAAVVALRIRDLQTKSTAKTACTKSNPLNP
jgi:hypothetical protein